MLESCLMELRASEPQPLKSRKLQSPQDPLKTPALPAPAPLQSLDLSPSEKASPGPLITLPPLPEELSQPTSAYYEAWL